MRIKRVETVEQYKAEQNKHVENWIADHFNPNCITWTWKNAFTITLKDTTGATLDIDTKEIP